MNRPGFSLPMNIVILGAGTVGTSIADLLSLREDSVTVVDIDGQKTSEINEKFDVRVVTGSASQSSVLFQAGIVTADVCLAVTGCDEINIVAASIAKSMGCRRSLARVFAPVFRDLSTFDYQRHFQIDRLLSLEHLAAMELARGIRDPSTVIVEQYARGGMEVREVVVNQEGKATRAPIRSLGLPPNVRLATIQRENRMWIAGADDQLQIGDRVTIFSRHEDMKKVKSFFRTYSTAKKRIVIAGGGETGLHLAQMLEREGYPSTIIEENSERCKELAKILESTSIVNCDATQRENLEEERVGNADVFAACTGDDEDNMMMSVEAKDLGTKQVLTVIDRENYSNITRKLGIDLAVTQRGVMARQVLAYLTEGAIISRAKLPGGLINIIEIDVVPDSPITKGTLSELGLPERLLVAAIGSQDSVRVPGGDDRVQGGDTAIILVEDDVADVALSFFAAQA